MVVKRISVGSYFLTKLLLVIAITMPFQSFSQQQYGTTKGLILLSGIVIDQDSVELSDVHIYNQNNRQVLISDPSGFFSIYAAKSHVLRFTSIGYETKYVSIPADFKGEVYFTYIMLKERVTPLENVTIIAKEEETQSMLKVPERPKPFGEYGIGTLQSEPVKISPGIGSPISMLYEWFSKKAKEERKLKEILASDAIRKNVDKRFESELIWEMTGLYGDDLERFKRFCNLPRSFVLYSNEYDFLVAVKDCFYKYQNR